ncbi:alpha/beta superfamily hydrolase [Mycoplana sp. BE70]|uniref:hypothetical protein n=1 Tax=Mycoplana sp. BE70 TaxID=2817775 RepID=UPI00285582A2|nr:hypothetical protein [Mycoplana sp. BE70]MDR6759754.1 alpha/beta superfamily hydrolase [Mycoplana sp. BE70]
MNIPTWIKPALTGAAVGAFAMVVFGFSWGGWVTSGTARNISASDVSSGVALALTPYCVERSKSDPAAANVLAQIKAASIYGRRSIVEKSGWATPLGTDQPNSALASACGDELVRPL